MSKQTQAKATTNGTVDIPQVQDFIIAKVGARYVRFLDIGTVPEGSETITLEAVNSMTKEAICKLYSDVAVITLKNFKDKRIATESLLYQVNKMPTFDPNAPPPTTIPAGTKTAKSTTDKKSKNNKPDNFELLRPPEVEKVLKGLAPQARELVSIMADLAKEKGSTSFSGNALVEKLKVPEVTSRLHTRQDPLRILQYYKGQLIGVGLIRVS